MKKLPGVQIDVSKNQILRAQDLYDFHNLKTSIKDGGAGELVGAIGEIVFEDYYKEKVVRENTKDYDFVTKGLTIDVKTKYTSIAPDWHYNCSIPTTSKHQNCDFYCFMRVSYDHRLSWLLGSIHRVKFYQKAVLMKKGQTDEEGFTYPVDSWVVKVSDLSQPK